MILRSCNSRCLCFADQSKATVNSSLGDTGKDYPSIFNELFDWSLKFDEFINQIMQPDFEDYIAWKISFSAAYLEDNFEKPCR